MKVESIDRIINFDNGESFKIGEKVILKEINKDEKTVVIDGISPVFDSRATISFYTDKDRWFSLEIHNIEYIKHLPMKTKEIVHEIKDYESVSILCPKCNWNVDSGDKYCKHCGQVITS